MRAILKSPPNAWLFGGFGILRAGASEAIAENSISNSSAVDAEPVAASHDHRQRRPEAQSPLTRASSPRRTPRKSLIVVLPENCVVSPDLVSERLAAHGGEVDVDVILACAGQPNGIGALQRRVRDLQVLLAPAGTSGEDLRELAMEQAPGDIVTLVSGVPA